ncbi:hypothetical protein ACFLZ9_01105 [Patescibacteria group bacterium]
MKASWAKIKKLTTNKIKNILPPLKRAGISIFNFIKNNFFNIVLVIIGGFTLYMAITGVSLQNKSLQKDQVPFFKYSYDKNDRVFKVSGGDGIDIVSADWILVGKWLFEEDKYSLKKINNLDKELGWYEIRDAYGQTLVNTLQDWGKDVIECEFFRLTQDAVPAMVRTTYDTKENSSLNNTDLILITRMDTEKPNPQVKLRNVSDEKIINNFFNENIYQIESATEHIKEDYEYSNENYTGNLKSYTGKCGILMNQPMEGY